MTLKPWREIAEPHEDVRKGTFVQAEFAADCWRRPKIDPPCRLKIDPVQIADFSLSNCG